MDLLLKDYISFNTTEARILPLSSYKKLYHLLRDRRSHIPMEFCRRIIFFFNASKGRYCDKVLVEELYPL